MIRALTGLLFAAAAAFTVGVSELPAQGNCVSNWTASEYRSFGDVQSEIKSRYGDVRILRILLCGRGGQAQFQVVIISGKGEVQRVQVAASN